MSEWFAENIGWLLATTSILTATATWYLSRRHDITVRKEALAVTLYNDFCDADMLRSRIDSDKILKKAFEESPKSDHTLYKELPTDEWLPISRILHFFERVEVSIRTGIVAEPLAINLFKKDFCYYWSQYFSCMYEADNMDNTIHEHDDMWRDIEKLSRRMRGHA